MKFPDLEVRAGSIAPRLRTRYGGAYAGSNGLKRFNYATGAIAALLAAGPVFILSVLIGSLVAGPFAAVFAWQAVAGVLACWRSPLSRCPSAW